ncbi:site-specific integrase [Micromonospora sp. Llam0]|uniref:site-specific integrase n=1 Tax=Micromonospora sp. Llam0 TaxID=2485143 RepID=UPI001F17BE0B|nr:site-specific integrase [Micromonospora sp. Llam0]
MHTETACRRGGALGLRLTDLDTHRGLVRLTEKGAALRWQPITLDLAAHLDDHARTRGAVLPSDQLLRYRNGRPITSRRYDHLWKRIGEQLPWVATQGISAHWLRHATPPGSNATTAAASPAPTPDTPTPPAQPPPPTSKPTCKPSPPRWPP